MEQGYYEKDGRRYDRVTRILETCWPSPDLIDWKIDVGRTTANRVSRRARKVGTEVDLAITAQWAGTAPTLEGVESRFAYRGFLEWQAAHQITPVAWQHTVYDEKLQVAGTIDCYTNDTVYDWKTSQRFEASHVLQICKYAQMLWRTYHMPTQHITLVRFDKLLATYDEWHIPEYLWGQAWEVFDGLVPAYRAIQHATFERG